MACYTCPTGNREVSVLRNVQLAYRSSGIPFPRTKAENGLDHDQSENTTSVAVSAGISRGDGKGLACVGLPTQSSCPTSFSFRADKASPRSIGVSKLIGGLGPSC